MMDVGVDGDGDGIGVERVGRRRYQCDPRIFARDPSDPCPILGKEAIDLVHDLPRGSVIVRLSGRLDGLLVASEDGQFPPGRRKRKTPWNDGWSNVIPSVQG